MLFPLLVAYAQAQNTNEPILKSYNELVYPPIARAARVSGQVSVDFSIDAKGETAAVAATNGPAMLRDTAEKFVKSWKFDLGASTPIPNKNFQAAIQFNIEGKLDSRIGPNVTVQSDSFHHFVITTYFSDFDITKCPIGSDTDVPPTNTVDDYVELSRSGCFGSCPAYSVKVQADGRIIWKGIGNVAVIGKHESRIDIDAARTLLNEFRTKDFWSYCGSYSRSVTDSSGAEIEVSLGGKKRIIDDYAGSSPKALQELLLNVDRTSDSHRWRHGDPSKEPITRLDSDCYLPKPGVTPLMLAACNNEIDRLKALIAAGADVKQTDASGWSALMYASGYSSDDSVRILLKAGADPNQRSTHGDTPLMVNALSRNWNRDLIKAGASVNAQNKDGQTVLMILATRDQDVDEIHDALQAAADPTLKDNKGRTALDYLKLTNCGKSPIADPVEEWMVLGNRKCTTFPPEDLRKTRKLLEEAVAKSK
jgi:TonB family protein